MERLKNEAQKLMGLKLSDKHLQQLKVYENELLEWNSRFNLTAVRDREGIEIKHFLDSLSCVIGFGDRIPVRLIDIGTGAGFPGIPLKILYPQMQLTLVESVGKKAEFCRHIVNSLCLERVEVLSLRAEEIGQAAGHREKYDWAVARAVANLPVLVEYLLPLVKIGGAILAQKGENAPAETQAAEHPAHLLGGRIKQLHQIHLPGVVETRYLVVIDKIAATPRHYPRRVGIPGKTPLK